MRYSWPSIVKGNTFRLVLTVTDSVTELAKDLTGASATWIMYDTSGSSAYTRATGGSGITITDAVNGILQVDGDTSSLSPGSYTGYLDITDGSGKVSTVYIETVQIVSKD